MGNDASHQTLRPATVVRIFDPVEERLFFKVIDAYFESIKAAGDPEQGNQGSKQRHEREYPFNGCSGCRSLKGRPGQQGSRDRNDREETEYRKADKDTAFDRLSVQILSPTGNEQRTDKRIHAAWYLRKRHCSCPDRRMIGITGIVIPEDQGAEQQDFSSHEYGQTGDIVRAEYVEKRFPIYEGKNSAGT